MDAEDKKSFYALMLGAGDLYSKEVTKSLLRIYFTALEGIPFEEVTQAMTAHVRDPEAGSFFPKPADLLRHVKGTPKDEALAAEDRATLAWAAILDQMKAVGSYGRLKIADRQALAAVHALGGWQRLCLSTYDDLVWREKDFRDRYLAFERSPLECLPDYLPGTFELEAHPSAASRSLGEVAKGIEERQKGASMP